MLMTCCISNRQTFSQKIPKQTRYPVSHICQIWEKTIPSLVRSSPNSSHENAKFRIPKWPRITPNCPLFLGTYVQVGWHAWESLWITLCLRQLQSTKTLNSKGINAAYHCAAQKAPFNAPAEALSFLLQLLDGPFFRRTALGLPRHCGVTLVAPSRDWIFCRKIGSFLTQKLKNMHHFNLFPFCSGHLPALKRPKPLPAWKLQPRCNGMFFHWAGIQRPAPQILAIDRNRVQELKENNVLIGCFIVTD